MPNSELWGKVLTGLITAIATLLVCLLNNYFQNKRERIARESAHQKQLHEMQETYFEKIGEIKDDYTGQVRELRTAFAEFKHLFEKMGDKQEHAMDLLNAELKSLSKKQDAYNNLQARTYALETDVALHKEKIQVANHRIEDLERKVN